MDDIDRKILDIESKTFRFVGAKERRVREATGLTMTKYFVRLNQLLETGEALQYRPAVVNRLRGMRER